MARHLTHNHERDGIDRRGFLECMAWAGTGVLWTISAGVPGSRLLGAEEPPAGLSFVQISDSHIGFNKDANPDVTATLQVAIDRINNLATPPAFLIHTGDITHLSKPAEFDTADSLLQSVKTGARFFVPGEHDTAGKEYLARYGKKTTGDGWYSFDHSGVHFVGLVSTTGSLGSEQIEWLEKDLEPLSASTPVVVFAHIPLWTIYPEWGWTTKDSEQALSYLRRFGSVTVLNGHIHQTMQKVEGNITFHTACSTAFPQPKPGAAAGPGPMKVPAEDLRKTLGLTSVRYSEGKHALALTDVNL
jgi:3',5'-cyclic AMP phosphodiesterase CpdA